MGMFDNQSDEGPSSSNQSMRTLAIQYDWGGISYFLGASLATNIWVLGNRPMLTKEQEANDIRQVSNDADQLLMAHMLVECDDTWLF